MIDTSHATERNTILGAHHSSTATTTQLGLRKAYVTRNVNVLHFYVLPLMTRHIQAHHGI